MTFDALMKDLRAGKYKPLYLLQGDEDFFIDRACHFFEHELLSQTEQDFNLSVFYGKDADWSEVVNACGSYPVFAEKKVVILKEAQSMKTSDFNKLENYLKDVMASTIFVITYKKGKIDGRSSISKAIKKNGVELLTKKVYDNQLPTWIRTYAKSKGYDITEKACMLMANHIGTDLSVQANEIGKICINLPEGKKIDDTDVEKYVGISREYNVFELQNAIGAKDVVRVMEIVHYFEANPKAGPLALILPILYNFFSKVEMLIHLQSKGNQNLASAMGVSPFFLKDYQKAARQYQLHGTERVLLLLYEYNLRMLGVNDGGLNKTGLLKELVGKALMVPQSFKR